MSVSKKKEEDIVDNKKSTKKDLKTTTSKTTSKDSKSVLPKSSIKETNPYILLKNKKEIVNNLRVLVNGNEDNDTFNKVKDLQNKWKDIGQINNSKDRSLWTTYNALLDRFYDNRSIYFELKELDRK